MLQTLNTFILACGTVGGDDFGFNIGFKTGHGILFENLDFPALPGAVKVNSIVSVAKSHGNDVRSLGVGKGDAEEFCF
jgi:hypothetical protein